jgi:D-alanine--poly(phosphoribitol) ligase subunit 1
MSILESITANATAHPERLAYVHNTPNQTYALTWRELEEYSNKLGTLIVNTAQSSTPVVVYGHKDPLVITSFLACSKSGRAYVPVDTSVPEGRLQDIVHEVAPEIILAVADLPDIDCGDARAICGRIELFPKSVQCIC